MPFRGRQGWRRTRVVAVELAAELPELGDLDGTVEVLAVVRLHGFPVGTVRAPVVAGGVTSGALRERIVADLGHAIRERLVADALGSPGPLDVDRLTEAAAPELPTGLPTVTVAVCSRDRPDDLARCLDALLQLDLDCEVLVVDNAPSTEDTARLVRDRFPTVRYVREERPGLDWARSRAALEARGEVVAYTDDDVIVDPGWARAIAEVFADDPQVMAVTGLVLPVELDSEAQDLFERYGGFSRGFRRRWYQADLSRVQPRLGPLVAAGNLGTGANMAYRRSVFSAVGSFDPALDVGTVTGGAGDHDMFFRVLKGGWRLAYEPKALVWHRHRRTMAELRRQIDANASVFAYFEAAATRHPEERKAFARATAMWLWGFHARQLLVAVTRPTGLPPRLVASELVNQARVVLGRRYARAAAQAERIGAAHGPQPGNLPPRPPERASEPVAAKRSEAVAVVALEDGLGRLTGLGGHNAVRVYLSVDEVPVATVKVPCHGSDVSARQLREAVAQAVGVDVVEPGRRTFAERAEVERQVDAGVARLVRASSHDRPTPLAEDVAVSVVISTFDRPDDLRRCLTSLRALRTRRSVQVVVVDNHPGSGITAPLSREFPEVTFVEEARQGVAFGRNRGILASHGEIIATIDDDAVAHPDWLERLLSAFSRADVAAATGNILPVELATPTQQHFEDYSGLGRGFRRFEVGPAWFAAQRHAVPTWILGGTCNAAFRRSIFADPAVGLMDEALGPGMPSGVGEDSYLLYRVLVGGHSVVYEPEAVVWHRHRSTPDALTRQLVGYYRGGVCHHLATVHHDADLRALRTLGRALPAWHARELARSLTGRSDLPLAVWWNRVRGTLAGPWAYARSLARVRRLGRTPLPGAGHEPQGVAPGRSRGSGGP